MVVCGCEDLYIYSSITRRKAAVYMKDYPYYCIMKTRNPNIYPSCHAIVTMPIDSIYRDVFFTDFHHFQKRVLAIMDLSKTAKKVTILVMKLICLQKILSKNFDMQDRILTGLQFSLSRLSPCLKTGDTFANFNSYGNTPFSRQSFTSAVMSFK